MNLDFSLLGIDFEKINSPAKMYRLMRPEYFSDSIEVKEKLPRDVFKHIMSKISTEMRQDAFEEFTRRCVQKLITPNIIPQTGPTGGGDAKADLISFPVSKETSSLWTVPEGGSSGTKKWAFAISSVQKWGTKMDRDVKKIVENISDITRIYFCTNQAVASRSRLAKQKKYQTEYHVDTVILDLNWYVQAVYDQGCYDDAIESLGLGDSLKLERKLGPRDTKREARLAELDKILPKTSTEGYDDKYVDALIEAARLTRELERPQQEVYGRFTVALNAAQRYGLPQQLFECIYQKAWTDFYWYENADSTYAGYCELKKMLDVEINITRIEKLFTLFQILFTANHLGLFVNPVNIQQEYDFFKDLYRKLKEEASRVSCTLFLRICLLEFELMQKSQLTDNFDEERINTVISELIVLLTDASHRLDINFESLADNLTLIGKLYDRNEKFDDLIDKVAEIQSSRDKDISAASIQFQRGLQNIENNNFVDAIRHLSRSYVLFQKEDTLTELVRTSAFLAYAYSNVDLLYSAKTYYVKSLSLLFNSMGNEGRSDHLIVTILLRLCEIELNLGQLATFLEWLSYLDSYVAILPNYLDKDFISDRSRLDALLGSLIHETPLNSEEFAILPDILERHQLAFSRNILMMKMGKRNLVSDEFKFMVDNEDTTKNFISQMTDHAHFLFPLVINSNKKGNLQTLVHGCTIRARYEGVTYEQTFCEMVLACIELLLESKIKSAPSTPVLNFEINCVNEGKTTVQQIGISDFKVTINKKTFSSQKDVLETLIQMLIHVLSGSVVVNDLRAFFEERQNDDFLMQRLSLLANYLHDISNIIPNYRYSFIEMFSKPEDKSYNYKKENETKRHNRANRQSDTIITSLIDTSLWDSAKWHGCGYFISYDYSEPSIMVLLFENIASGIKIFEKWEEEYRNKKLNLKIVIITKIDKEHPNWYKVLLTPDIKSILLEQNNTSERYVISASRFHLMNANSNDNIIRLQHSYAKFNFIGLSASAIINNQMSFDKDKRYNKVIPVRNVEFREAWTIGLNEPESVAILPSDKIIIPTGHENDAPVLAVLFKKQQNGSKNN